MLIIEQTGCGIFELSVDTGIATSVQVKTLTDDKILVVSQTILVPATGVYTLTLTDGVYALTNTVDSISYKIIVYCSLEECLLKKIGNLICEEVDCGCENKTNQIVNYDFNAVTLLAFAFYSLLNDIFTTGWQFASLSVSELDDLYVISKIISQSDKYCSCDD